MNDDSSHASGFLSSVKRLFFVAAGWLCVVLAVIGIFLPLLPTTPFLLLAAFCFSRGSKRFHDWLLNHRWFGSYIKNFQDGRGMTKQAKVWSVSLIWLSIGTTVLFFISMAWLKFMLLMIAATVSGYLLSRPTYKK